MELFAEQYLVDVLQLAERKRSGEQSERDWCVVDAKAYRVERGIDESLVSRGNGRKLQERPPRILRICVYPVTRVRVGDKPVVADGYVSVPRMAAVVAHGANLLEQGWNDADHTAGNAVGCGVNRLVVPWRIPGKRPSFATTDFG
jgi:hypothetical protein